jgi:hypothetical protein
MLSTLSALASLVPIGNSSFESPVVSAPPYFNYGPITDWTVAGTAGVWNPSTLPSAGLTAEDGVQVGYINGGSVSQVLGSSLQADSTYNLGIYVAGRADGLNPGTDYSISLYAGSTLLTSVTPVAPTTSVWTPLSASYTSGSSGLVGQPLEIVISTPASQLDFDNVSLSVSAVPEPTTMISGAMLLLPFGWSAFRQLRKKLQAA